VASYDVVACPACGGRQVALDIAATKTTGCRLPSCGRRSASNRWTTFASFTDPVQARAQLGIEGAGQNVTPAPKPPNQTQRLRSLLRQLEDDGSILTRAELEELFAKHQLRSALDSCLQADEIHRLSGRDAYTVSRGADMRVNDPTRDG
jgi:hypothetical protein